MRHCPNLFLDVMGRELPIVAIQYLIVILDGHFVDGETSR